jgi:hypothetical protein
VEGNKNSSDRVKRFDPLRDESAVTLTSFDEMLGANMSKEGAGKESQRSSFYGQFMSLYAKNHGEVPPGKPEKKADASTLTAHTDMSSTSPKLPVDLTTLARVDYARVGGLHSRSFDSSANSSRRREIKSTLIQASLSQHITDKGAVIPRRHWTKAPELNGINPKNIAEMAKKLMEHERKADIRFNLVKEVGKPSIEYNCHSYVFTNGRGGWLTATDAKKILEDNQFQLVASFDGVQQRRDPQAKIEKGDVVAYYTYFDAKKPIKEPPHSAVVFEVKGDRIWVTSKWGPYGLKVHPIDVVPKEYQQQWAIFHTDRKEGRLVNIDV